MILKNVHTRLRKFNRNLILKVFLYNQNAYFESYDTDIPKSLFNIVFQHDET